MPFYIKMTSAAISRVSACEGKGGSDN